MASSLLDTVSSSYKIISICLLMTLSCQNPNNIFKIFTFAVFATLSCLSSTLFLKFTSRRGEL